MASVFYYPMVRNRERYKCSVCPWFKEKISVVRTEGQDIKRKFLVSLSHIYTLHNGLNFYLKFMINAFRSFLEP